MKKINFLVVLWAGLLTSAPAHSMRILNNLKMLASKMFGEVSNPMPILDPSKQRFAPVNFDELLSEKMASSITDKHIDTLLYGSQRAQCARREIATVLLFYVRHKPDFNPFSKDFDDRTLRERFTQWRISGLKLDNEDDLHRSKHHKITSECMKWCDKILRFTEIVHEACQRNSEKKAKLLSLLTPATVLRSFEVQTYSSYVWESALDTKEMYYSLGGIMGFDYADKAINVLFEEDPRVLEVCRAGQIQRAERDKKEKKEEEEERERK